MAERKSIQQKKQEARDQNDKYFEAVLQLRYHTEEQFNEIFDFLEKSECRITKHIVQPEGIDLYIASQKFAQQFGKWVKNRYNCQVSSSRTLHTRDTRLGKDLYRVTILVFFMTHKVGDIVTLNGDEIKIMSLGTKPSGKILKTGKRIFIDARTLRDL
ncbi:MAG: NMD3-related protein [Candidatus Woesearchaeota archaeon]